MSEYRNECILGRNSRDTVVYHRALHIVVNTVEYHTALHVVVDTVEYHTALHIVVDTVEYLMVLRGRCRRRPQL